MTQASSGARAEVASKVFIVIKLKDLLVSFFFKTPREWMMTQPTRLLMTCYIITAPTPHHEWVISAAARGFRHFLDDVLNDFSDFFRLSFLLPSLPFD